jgi:DNA modification methylase
MTGENGPRLEMWALDRIKPYEKNPRTLPEKAVAKVVGSLKTFGFQKPIVVDEAGVIIAGHVVFKAAQQAGFTRVPVLISQLDAKAAKAYRLADNRTAQETDWLDDLLRQEVTALDDEGFDLASLGFDDRELQKLLSDDEEMARAEETPEPPANPVTIEGDVWLLGHHRIICGDSTKADVVDKVLAGVKPHLMVTDPPYGVNYDAAWRLEAGVNKAHQKRADGKVLNDDKADWTETWALFPGSVAYVWHGALHATEVATNLQACGFKIRSQIIWAKNSFIIGRGHYHWQHEPCWYAVKDTGSWSGDRKQSTLWQIQNMHAAQGNVDDGKTNHSTQKPVECMRRPIMNNSSPGQAVYEPFSGSGTTIIAGEMTGRHVYAIELNPAYVDVAVKRWQDFTGQKGTLEGDGRTFEEIDTARYDKTGAKDDSAKSYDTAIDALRQQHIETQNAAE